MADSQPSRALTKRSASTALMPPPPPPKRIKRPAIVIDEDAYTSSLSHIIARDFFPGLLESDVQQEYLDAVESRDKAWIQEAGAKLMQLMTPGPASRGMRGRRGVSMTPLRVAVGETPRWTGGDTPVTRSDAEQHEEEEDHRQRPDTNMNLSAFQAKYTSEDNESFNALLDKQNIKRAEKYAWLHGGNKILSGRQIAWRDRQQKLLRQSEEQDARQAKYGETNADNQLVRRPTHPDDRPAMPDVKPSKPRNSFMFDPDSLEDVQQTTAQAAEERSNAPPKQIKYDNTRLPAPATEGSVAPSPSMSAIDAAIAGRPRGTESEPGYDGSSTPRVNGYGFVDEEPTPRELGQEQSPRPDENLLALLGETGGGGPNPFKLAEASKRETLHHAMVEKTSKSKRTGNRLDVLKEGKKSSSKTPTPKFLSATPKAGAGNLTPVAQQLLHKIGTPGRGKVASSIFGGRSKADERWTPKVALTPRRDV